jgi:hypothetical protein
MKKLAICILVAMMTLGLSITASAKEVFEATLVPVGGGDSTGKIEVSERGEVKVEIEDVIADLGTELSIFFVPFYEEEACLVGTVEANGDGEFDTTEFDASWIGECLGVELVEPVTFIGLFEVRDDSGPLFITGFSLDPENLAIDEPEVEEEEEEEEKEEEEEEIE